MLHLSDAEREKIRPADMSFIILNNLNVFNDKPEMIKDLIDKIEKAGKDALIYTHVTYYKMAYEQFYVHHKKFPDIEWLNNVLPSMPIKRQNFGYSITIYEDFLCYLDREYASIFTKKLITDNNNFSGDDIQLVVKALTEYQNRSNPIKRRTAEDMRETYKRYSENYKGVKTHIKQLDDVIGVLGYKSMSVFGAPSGCGKSTFAITLAYNVAVFGGMCVDYVTFEVPEDHLWFNLCSIESTYTGDNISSNKWKHSLAANEEEKNELNEKFYKCNDSLRRKLNEKGGFINPIDYSRLSASSYEEFCAKLEAEAEQRERKADLIIIDNIDGFSGFRGTDKDPINRVDTMIRSLDQFSRSYYNNEGTHFLLLTQTNREGMLTLKNSLENDSNENGKKKKQVEPDMRAVSRYNALYEKAVNVFLGASQPGSEILNIYHVKGRDIDRSNSKCIKVKAEFAYSKIGGEVDKICMEGYNAFKVKKEEEAEERKNTECPTEEDDFKEE